MNNRLLRGLAAQPRNFQSEFNQDARVEKGPFVSTGRVKQDGTITQTGNVTLTGNQSISGTLTVGGTSITGAYAKGDMAYAVHPGPRQYTSNDDWTNVNSTNFALDGDSFALTSLYFEVLGCVEVGGRTGYYRIYNVTDGTALTDSTVDTSATSSEAEGWINAELIRSSTLTFPSGNKEYRVQMKQDVEGTAGDMVQFFKANIFYKLA